MLKTGSFRSGIEIAHIATCDFDALERVGNAELLALSGPRNPYPGKLGVIEPGALADLLLVDGDPLADIAVLQDKRRILAVMKDGQFHRAPPLHRSSATAARLETRWTA